jgi:hypothetical protein
MPAKRLKTILHVDARVTEFYLLGVPLLQVDSVRLQTA